MTQGSSQFRDTKRTKEVSPDDASDKTTSSRKSISSEALMKYTRAVIKDRDSTDSTHQSDSEQSSISKFYLRRDSNSASESSSERSFHEQTNETEELQQLLTHAKDDFHNSAVYMRTQSELRQAKDDYKATEAYQVPKQAVKEARTQLKNQQMHTRMHKKPWNSLKVIFQRYHEKPWSKLLNNLKVQTNTGYQNNPQSNILMIFIIRKILREEVSIKVTWPH